MFLMRSGKTYIFLLFVFIISVLLFVVMLSYSLSIYCTASNGHVICRWIINLIKNEVVYDNNHIMDLNDNTYSNTTMIYVLGGNQKDLSGRYEVASGLYHRRISGKIYFLSREGITEFSPAIKRNLTNDEWSVREMGIHDVKAADTIPVSVPDGIFGTLSEAEVVAEIAKRSGCRRLVLVSSVNHTRRVFTTFRSVLSSDAPQVYVYGAEDENEFEQLLTEYAKLLSYEYFALPARKIREMFRFAGTKRAAQNRNRNNGNEMVAGKMRLQVVDFIRIRFGIISAKGIPENIDPGMPYEDGIGEAHRKIRSLSNAFSLGGRMRVRG